MSEKELTPREQAVAAIKEGNSVWVEGTLYSLYGNEDYGTKGLDELPPEEYFITGNSEARADVASKLQKEVAELTKRLEALQGKDAKAESAEKTTAKAEAKKEDK